MMMINGKSQPHVPPSWYPGISQGRPRSEMSANTGIVPPNKRISKIYFFMASVLVLFISLSPILHGGNPSEIKKSRHVRDFAGNRVPFYIWSNILDAGEE